jgi:hypothetical protein
VAALFDATGSGEGFCVVPAVTPAVLLMTVPPGVPETTLTTSVNVADAALARLPIVPVTVPELPTAGVVHVHPDGQAKETNLVLVGSESDRRGLSEAFGPLFVTVIV